MPPVAIPRREPGKRSEGARDPRPDHGRLCADGEHVRADPGECAEVTEPARQAEHPGEPEDTEGDEHDVRAAHRQEVVEPRGPEGILEAGREVFVLAEHDAFEDRAALSREPGCERAREPGADAVRVAADPAPAADDAPVGGLGDHVDPVTPEPGALVEAVGGRARQLQPRVELEDGALGRSAAERELEQDGLAGSKRAEPRQLRGHAQVEAARPRRPGDDEARRRALPGQRREHARVERVQAQASPPPAREQERERQQGDPGPRVGHERCRERRADGEERDRERRHPRRVRQRQPGAGRAREHVGIDEQHPSHGTTSPRSCSTRAGPIPGIASRSSTERRAPWAVR